jgi:hypothetical protein
MMPTPPLAMTPSGPCAMPTSDDGITIATRDRRATETYRALDVDFELIQ